MRTKEDIMEFEKYCEQVEKLLLFNKRTIVTSKYGKAEDVIAYLKDKYIIDVEKSDDGYLKIHKGQYFLSSYIITMKGKKDEKKVR